MREFAAKIQPKRAHNPGSRNRLNTYHLDLFAGDTLHDRLGRAVCRAECLPRKEFYEAWSVARRVRKRVRGGTVWDLAAGHGLVAMMMLLLDNTSERAICVDRSEPLSFQRLLASMTATWPRLHGRITYQCADLRTARPVAGDVVVCVHGCGLLTDHTLDVAIATGAHVAVLPCCHNLKRCDLGPFAAWMDGALAVDVVRAGRLVTAGYQVHTQRIDPAITPKNRLLLGLADCH